MDAKTLIDGIIRQTTVLVAQLSTSAGLRAPLAHVADQIFVELAREIEAQGVGRKVVADMFGLALRSYQKKVTRLTESVTQREASLWEAVLKWLDERGSATRGQVLMEFCDDEPAAVAAVLNDLVESGLLYSTGRGETAMFGATTQADRRRMYERHDAESLESWLAYELAQKPRTVSELASELQIEEDRVRLTVDSLQAGGWIASEGESDQPRYRAEQYRVPVGSEKGWETAVYDHVQAVMQAVIAKLARGPRSADDDLVGGATLRFDLTPDHPLREEVLSLLRRVRADVNDLWQRVEAETAKNPGAPEERDALYFYLGQNFIPAEPKEKDE